MNKKLNTADITNELSGASSFFRARPATSQPVKPPVTEVFEEKPQGVPVPIPRTGYPVPPYPLDGQSDNDNHSTSSKISTGNSNRLLKTNGV